MILVLRGICSRISSLGCIVRCRPRPSNAGDSLVEATAGEQAEEPQAASVTNGSVAAMALAGRASEVMAPVVLLLVGPPGSGKSTFSAALIAQAQALWTRVNQVLTADEAGPSIGIHLCCTRAVESV